MAETVNSVETNELIPPEGDDNVGPRIFEILSDILKYREGLKKPEDWTRFYELRRNKHWKTKTESSIKLLSANMLGSHHQRTVNMLTDNNPTFNAVQAGDVEGDPEEEMARLTHTIDDWWNDREQQHVLEESVSTGEMYGSVGEFLSYNPKINYPDGEVEVETLDPFYYGLYPVRCRNIEKSEAFLRWYPMTVMEAKRRWPEQAGSLTGDLALLEEIRDDRSEVQESKKTVTQTVINSLSRFLSGDQPSRSDSDELMVIETWVRDYSKVDDKYLYKGNIRRIRCCNGGDIVLDDHDNPSINPELDPEIQVKNYLYSRFPGSHTQSVTDTASPFGMADFEQLESLNIEVNKTISQLTMYKDKASRLKLINPKDSGVTNDHLDNKPGIINPTNHIVGQAIRYLDPPAMQGDVVSVLGIYKDFFNEVAGTFTDVLQGSRQGSDVIAYKAIAALLEEASRMLKGKIRNYSKMIRERGRMYIALAQNFYTDGKFISIPRNGSTETVRIDRTMLQIPGKISVVNGSTMPVSLVQKREESLTLFKMGAIDQEELLKSVDWQNYKDVIARMKEGPLGEFLKRLGMIGVPKQLLAVFKQAAAMDEKKIESAVKEGKIPPFMEVLKAIMQQQPPEKPDPELIKIQIEAKKAEAEIAEIMAKAKETSYKAELAKEKIITERVEQQVKLKGVKFDEAKLKMLRAETVDRIKTSEQERKLGVADAVVKTGKDVVASKSTNQNKQGPYAERGLKSNNQDV